MFPVHSLGLSIFGSAGGGVGATATAGASSQAMMSPAVVGSVPSVMGQQGMIQHGQLNHQHVAGGGVGVGVGGSGLQQQQQQLPLVPQFFMGGRRTSAEDFLSLLQVSIVLCSGADGEGGVVGLR